ncbi:hypothetical protein HXX76_012578 [Chlamydomonas incerta]|uniref:Gag1-like clamp domain-containing protein n=1 Tax=Chlamydomonas incerta TaxID=51695 RepID=A0A835VRZ6_CHLIN|nr:hypothetical protein HXX76_012578 [Chlamydomonas incerta]|eukprot:KAG2427062.1 hypothetical protein HXX76_012578 [Chlamydomonas incerta]
MASASQGKGQDTPREGAGTSEGSQEAMNGGWVNEGYQRWVEQRKEWTSGTRPAQPRHRQLPILTHEMVLGEKPFPKAVPLEAVVECLVEIWEEEDAWD